MSTWSIHSENGKYVVRDKSTGKDDRDPSSVEGEEFGSYPSRIAAANKISELEAEQKKDIAIAAARELLKA